MYLSAICWRLASSVSSASLARVMAASRSSFIAASDAVAWFMARSACSKLSCSSCALAASARAVPGSSRPSSCFLNMALRDTSKQSQSPPPILLCSRRAQPVTINWMERRRATVWK
jgi:hypothetical protein